MTLEALEINLLRKISFAGIEVVDDQGHQLSDLCVKGSSLLILLPHLSAFLQTS